MISIAQSHEKCARICAASGSNFIAAFRFLPRRERMAMEAVYAFMRTADDLADAEASLACREEMLRCFRVFFESSLNASVDPSVSDAFSSEIPSITSADADWRPIFPALLEVIRQYRIPAQYFFDVLDGVQMDLEPKFFQTAEELETYSYRVASAVGLICLHVWGVPPEEIAPKAQTPVFRAAVSCGKAFQWTNILRDVREDAENGRLYLPLTDLKDSEIFKIRGKASQAEFAANVQKRILSGDTDLLLPAIQKNLRRTEKFYQETAPLYSAIPPSNRRVFQLMMAVYHRIFLKIRRNPAQIFQKRIKLSKLEKIFLYFRLLFG